MKLRNRFLMVLAAATAPATASPPIDQLPTAEAVAVLHPAAAATVFNARAGMGLRDCGDGTTGTVAAAQGSVKLSVVYDARASGQPLRWLIYQEKRAGIFHDGAEPCRYLLTIDD